jgi:hypothetical protein
MKQKASMRPDKKEADTPSPRVQANQRDDTAFSTVSTVVGSHSDCGLGSSFGFDLESAFDSDSISEDGSVAEDNQLADSDFDDFSIHANSAAGKSS